MDNRQWKIIDGQDKENEMEKPALDATLVQEFVGNAHGNFARVKELLEQEPALINATWDWGGGDFETALGAAAHMGNKQIANYLLEHGARLDIFAAAMLGKLEVVKAALEAYPEMVNTPGPHGIPLITHAEAGGDDAKSVLEFLNSLE
jgi:ankyrin repeat protein